MSPRLAFASTLTLSLLFAALGGVLFLAAVLSEMPSSSLWLVMGLNLALTLGAWVFGPWIMDRIQAWFYKVTFLEFDAFERRYPVVGGFMREVCEREDMPLPQMRIIHDDNPTAYTYGTVPSNSRIAVSDGLFRFCSDREVQAVCAHELGHIRHYDFAVMTLATVLLQLLYETYFYLKVQTAERSNRITENLKHVRVLAYVLWWLGTYLVLWLSRTREYMADAFAAEQMGDAAPLQRALVKIAYGLAEVRASGVDESARGGRLLQATRALGIADPKASDAVGRAVAASSGQEGATHGSAALDEDVYGSSSRVTRGPRFDAELFEPVLAFDLVNPWALVSELGSTHPLTGKRLRALEEINAELGQPPLFDFERVAGQDIDRTKMWSDFSFEVFIWFLPQILPLFAVLASASRPEIGPGLVLAAVGLGFLLRGAYSYAMLGEFEPATMYELMCDPYASPLRGRPVELTGEIVGKGNPGSKYSEDMMMKDRSGGLVHLNYESLFGFLGNVFFGSRTADKAIGRSARVHGWFRRGITQYVDVYEADIRGQGYVPSYTRGWQISGGAVLLVVGLLVAGIGLALPRGFAAAAASDAAEEQGLVPEDPEEPYQIPSLDP